MAGTSTRTTAGQNRQLPSTFLPSSHLSLFITLHRMMTMMRIITTATPIVMPNYRLPQLSRQPLGLLPPLNSFHYLIPIPHLVRCHHLAVTSWCCLKIGHWMAWTSQMLPWGKYQQLPWILREKSMCYIAAQSSGTSSKTKTMGWKGGKLYCG